VRVGSVRTAIPPGIKNEGNRLSVPLKPPEKVFKVAITISCIRGALSNSERLSFYSATLKIFLDSRVVVT